MKLIRLFDDRTFYKSLFAIAVPIMLQNLISSLVNMAAIVMIGRLGTTEIAAVGLGNQVFFLLNMILFGVGSGATVFTAQYWGKGDVAGIRKNTGLSLIIVLSVAAAFTALCVAAPRLVIGLYSNDANVIDSGAAYLRSVAPSFLPFAVSFVFTLIMRTIEKVKLSMLTTAFSLGINVLLNYAFIFGVGPLPAMGVVGAALATIIARVIEMALLVGISYGRKYALAGTVRLLFGFDAAFVRRFFQIALPVILNELFWSLGITMQSVIFARTNTDAIAAFNITNTVSQLTWVVFIGLGNGGAVLIGKKIGEGNESTARAYAARLTLFAPLAALFVGLWLVPISAFLPRLFNVNANVLSIIAPMFIILTVVYPFRAFNMTMIVGVCRAGGDTVFSVLYDVLFMWTVSLPLAGLASFAFHSPVWIIYLCITSEDLLKMGIGLQRLRGGKWLRNVT